MATQLSRRKIASYVAERIAAGDEQAPLLRDIAAYLIANGRENECDLLVRDIEEALLEHNVVVADITVAEKMAIDYSEVVAALHDGAKTVAIREHIDPSVIGGIKISLPGERYDATVRTKIDSLKQLAA